MIKHLITGGCSFSAGQDQDGWTALLTKELQKSSPNLTYEHTGYLSQGQDLIQKKVILAILDALKNGIAPENILAVVMWSGTSRKAWYIDNPDIIQAMTLRWKSFHGGMSSQLLDLKNKNLSFQKTPGWFETSNGSQFDYNPEGGWYFTVDGSDCPLSFVQDYYLMDEHAHGVGKVHISIENIIMLQTFCKLHGVKLINQFFMDRVYLDIENYKDHQIIKYLYKEFDLENSLVKGMFEYIHQFLPIENDKIEALEHHERKRLDNGRKLFHEDGFHPGETGVELWCKNMLFPFLRNKGLI
jgi:hypothetical protein